MQILIVLNGSPQDEVILDWIVQNLSPRRGQGTLLLVTDKRKASASYWAEKYLIQARQRLDFPDLRTRIRFGAFTEVVVEESNQNDYDLVIISPERTPKMIGPMMGSMVERLINRLACPILILKGPAHSIQRILLCDSGAKNSKTIQRFAARLAGLLTGDVQVTILHVMSQITAGPGVRGGLLRAEAEELIQAHSPEGDLLTEDLEILEKLDLHPSPKIRHGLVVEEILAEARSGSYHMVVIGAHQNSGWQRFLLDDLARKIVGRLDRSVLVVK